MAVCTSCVVCGRSICEGRLLKTAARRNWTSGRRGLTDLLARLDRVVVGDRCASGLLNLVYNRIGRRRRAAIALDAAPQVVHWGKERRRKGVGTLSSGKEETRKSLETTYEVQRGVKRETRRRTEVTEENWRIEIAILSDDNVTEERLQAREGLPTTLAPRCANARAYARPSPG
jgi:hypothetical protein